MDKLIVFALLVLLAFGAFSKTQRMKWGKKRGWKCTKCGRRWTDGWMLEFDHILPSSQGGLDTEENADLVCLGCHAVKHRNLETQARISARLVEQRFKRNE